MKVLEVISEVEPEWPGDVVVRYNGETMLARDIPDSYFRKSMGIGHFNPYNRLVVEAGPWPYTPDTCEYAEFTQGHWDREGTVLVCAGCGLDCT